jgi:hypothetical protein
MEAALHKRVISQERGDLGHLSCDPPVDVPG